MLTFVLLVCVALFGAGSMQNTVTTESLEKVFRTYFEAFCDDILLIHLMLSEGLIHALEACTSNNAEEYNKAIQSCLADVGNGATTYFEHIKAACEDETLGPKFITCMEKYTNDSEFLKRVSDHAATEACFDKTFKDLGIEKVDGIYFPKNQ